VISEADCLELIGRPQVVFSMPDLEQLEYRVGRQNTFQGRGAMGRAANDAIKYGRLAVAMRRAVNWRAQKIISKA
jgi:hypothetical protein